MNRILLFVAGLGLGLGAGLLYAWVIRPAQYVDTDPTSLRADYKTEYIQLVAQSFAVDGDVDRARARLIALGEPDPARTVTALAQRAAASGGDPDTVWSLAALASALGARPAFPTPPPVTEVEGSATPEATLAAEPSLTPEPTLVPVSTATPIPHGVPTQPPAPTFSGAFVFVGKQPVCDAAIGQPLIQVQMLDANASPVPGAEVIVEWDGGFDHFFTGLKPEMGNGYGDFTMAEGINYTVRLASMPAAAITGLRVETCTDAGGRQFLGSWLLVFRQP
jgi:hypothetical protein